MPAATLQTDPATVARTMAAMDRHAEPAKRRRLRASYDIAETHEQNENHWKWTDALSANALLTHGTRKTIRERARYEYQNNTLVRGIVLRVSNDLIGTGPRMQVLTADQEANAQIETDWHNWAAEIGLAEKLQTMAKAKIVDGEAFARFKDRKNSIHPVSLTIEADECDRYQSPFSLHNTETHVDGVHLDRNGDPVAYDRLRHHPGSDYIGAGLLDPERIPAYQVMHLFRHDRPEQNRGVSELASALRLFAEWRRYKLACMAAAETAANFAAVLSTDQPPLEQTDADYESFDSIPIQQRMMLTLPGGMKLQQLRSEQPPTTLEMFERSILREIGRALNLPFNVVAGDSSGYNFSSAKGDTHAHVRNVLVDRSLCWEQQCVNRIAAEWFSEYRIVSGGRFDGIDFRNLKIQWYWDDIKPDLDPSKTANARKTDMSSGAKTLPQVYDEMGVDADSALNRQAELFGITREELNGRILDSIYSNGNPYQPQQGEPSGEEA